MVSSSKLLPNQLSTLEQKKCTQLVQSENKHSLRPTTKDLLNHHAVRLTLFKLFGFKERRRIAHVDKAFFKAERRSLTNDEELSRRTIEILEAFALHPDIQNQTLEYADNVAEVKKTSFPSREQIELGRSIFNLPEGVQIDRTQAYIQHVIKLIKDPMELYLKHFEATWKDNLSLPEPMILCLQLNNLNPGFFNTSIREILNLIQLKMHRLMLSYIEEYKINPLSVESKASLLLKSGLDIHWAHHHNQTSLLHSAVSHDCTELADQLLKQGYEIDGNDTICLAVQLNNISMFQLLAPYYSKRELAKCAHNMLLYAIENNSVALLNAVMTSLGGILKKIKSGEDVLIIALLECKAEMLKLLLDHGLNPNFYCHSYPSRQESLLMRLAGSDNITTENIEKVRLLLNHGALVLQKDGEGNDALQHLRENRNRTLYTGFFSRTLTETGKNYKLLETTLWEAMSDAIDRGEKAASNFHS